MPNNEDLPTQLAAAMVGGAIFAVPILGWWPLVGIVAAVVGAHYVVSKLR